MLSKFLRFPNKLLARRTEVKQVLIRSHFIPPSQYDTPWPDKMKPTVVLTKYWETIPLFFCTFAAVSFLIGYIMYALKNKMDVVFTTHSRATIARTMDLRNPTIHKIVTINQKYEPWPEMQDVLDKMAVAEKRALVRAQACSLP